MKEWIVRAAYRMGGRNIDAELSALLQTERLPRDKLLELQWSRTQEIINCAYTNTVYYKNLFTSLNLTPDDFKKPEDLQKIPATEKHELRLKYAEFVNHSFRGKTTTYGSSGSTGEPILLRQSTKALAAYTAAQLRGRSWHNITPGDTEGKVWGAPLSGMDKLLLPFRNMALNRVQLPAFSATPEIMRSTFEKMRKRKVRYLYGYSSSLHHFSRFLESTSVSGKDLNLKAVIATSDMLPDDQKFFMESFWNCPVLKEYGAGETGIIAFECENRNLHITVENVFVEIVDNEVMATPLINTAMPLLRYRLNDAAGFKQGFCECGRELPLLAGLKGRSCDMALLPDGRSMHSDVFCYINRKLMEHGKEVSSFQIIQEGKTDFRILAVPSASGSIKPFVDGVRELLGNATVTSEQANEIPRGPSGKIRYVVSHYKTSDPGI